MTYNRAFVYNARQHACTIIFVRGHTIEWHFLVIGGHKYLDIYGMPVDLIIQYRYVMQEILPQSRYSKSTPTYMFSFVEGCIWKC